MSESRTLYIEGIKPAGEKHRALYDILERCIAAKITAPKEVLEYFGLDKNIIPTLSNFRSDGVVVFLEEADIKYGNFDDRPHTCIVDRQTNADSNDSYLETSLIVDVSKLPKDVTQIRIRARSSW